MQLKHVFAGAALAAGLALPSAAQASVTINSISGNPGFLSGQVIYTPGGIGGVATRTSQNLSIGRIRLAGTDNATTAAVTFDAYCIDIFNYVQNGAFDLQAFTLPDALKQSQIKTLLSYTAGFIDAAATSAQKRNISAAIQMAVWEIVNENGTAGYSLDNGLFQIGTSYGTVIPVARGLAQSYLGSMGGWSAQPGYSYRMMTAIDPIRNQRQVFLAAGAVPEPATWAMLILGFGLVGGAMRSRRKASTVFA